MPGSEPTPPTPSSPYDARPWLAHYPVGVPTDYAFPLVPLTRLLDDAASSFPTRTALAFFGATTSYRELKEAVDRFAGALRGLGVGRGDRVAVVLPNCPQNVITVFATLRLGAVVVQHDPLSTEAELRRQLADCGAEVVVCLDRGYAVVASVRADTAVQHVVVASFTEFLPTAARFTRRLPVGRAKRARDVLSTPIPRGAPVERFLPLLKDAPPARQVEVDPETDLALLQYTGGTTGVTRGAMLTHHNLVSNAYMNRLWDTGAAAGREVTLGVLPLSHLYGLTVCLNATVLLGGTLVLLPRFDVDQVLAAVERWRPTMFPGVPPIYQTLLDSPRITDHDLSSIRVGVSGAMRLPVELQQRFEEVTGGRLVEGYGLTETSPSTHCNPITGERRVGSIGLPLPGTYCRVLDPENPSREVPPGFSGELAVKGPQVLLGYWKDAVDPLTVDDWLLTGDLVVMDEDGFFTVVDRKKELVVVGGRNVYPSEVEQVLRSLPGVVDAAVVGVEDERHVETVTAFVVAAPGSGLTEQDVVSHCRAELSSYKVPRAVRFSDVLPRSTVGKVQRRVLVEQEQADKAARKTAASA